MFKKLSAILITCLLTANAAVATNDEDAVRAAVLNYIESQHVPNPERMDKALHEKMKKRTFWNQPATGEFLLETSRDTMLDVARTYNEDGTGFPAKPRKDIQVFDIDGRTASVKLTADEWIDYMHLMKSETGEWKVVNVLWQYHDQSKHISNQ